MIRKRRKKIYGEPKFGFPNIKIEDKIKKDAVGIFLFALALISALSFMGLAGNLGEGVDYASRLIFGIGAVLLPMLLFLGGWKIIKTENVIESRTSLLGMIAMILSFISFLHIFYDPKIMFETAKSGNGGGLLGAVFAWTLVNVAGEIGAFVVILMVFLISMLITFNYSLADLVQKIIPRKSIEETGKEKNGEEKENSKNAKEKDIDNARINISGKNEKDKGVLNLFFGKISGKKPKPEFSIKPIEEDKTEDNIENMEKNKANEKSSDNEDDKGKSVSASEKPKRKKMNWRIPSLELLDGIDGEPTSGDIKANMNIIKRTLADFGIPVQMGEVNVGPTVTQYNLKPAVGIKLSRITSLQNDLALSLAARSLRIEAPIPGKSWVGIEVPNHTVAMVRLKNMIGSNEFRRRKSNLSVVLGRDVAGAPILDNLARMPHLLIAGSTGSGKTVCINTLITGLLFQNSPEELKFIMVDPKRVELTSYNDIPHLLTPVITDPDKAINSLKWSISEMENRYDLLSHMGSRNVESYNAAVSAKYKQMDTLPYIIIVIDELADLMATHGREMEAAVVRLAQMARAVGIHLVLSTQRPSVEVITGLIKANITTRIAFQVASQIDSRTIIDVAGAEKLLGNGDMLYLSGDSNKPKRIQGVFVSEEEVKKVSDFLKNQREEENDYNEEIIENKKTALELSFDENGIIDDNLYYDAVEVVKNAGKASASLLQRRLRVGYARAARLLDLMEEQDVIGPADGAKPREVYVGREEDDDSSGNDSEENDDSDDTEEK